MINIALVLENFAKLDESEQAHVVVTLLDFMQQHQEEFDKRYGTYSRGIIDKMMGRS